MPSKEAPVSLRLPEPLRNRVAEYASEREVAYHRALVMLIENGLGVATKPLEPKAPTTFAEPKPKPRGKKAPATEEPQRRTGGTEFCEHRVPVGSFCSRCTGMH